MPTKKPKKKAPRPLLIEGEKITGQFNVHLPRAPDVHFSEAAPSFYSASVTWKGKKGQKGKSLRINACRINETVEGCSVQGKKKTKDWKKATWKKGMLASEREALCTAAGGEYHPKVEKERRPGSVELEMFSPAQATKLGTKPGPNVRLCFRPGAPGILVPVESPVQVRALKEKFERCVGGSTDIAKAEKCAVQHGAAGAALGGFSRRR